MYSSYFDRGASQPAFTCSKLTIEPLEHGVKYFSVNNKDIRTMPGVVLVLLLLTLNIFHTLFQCFYCKLWTRMQLLLLLDKIYSTQKQLFRCVLLKEYSENMQRIYWRTPMPKWDFSRISAWVFSWKFAAYFQNIFLTKQAN